MDTLKILEDLRCHIPTNNASIFVKGHSRVGDGGEGVFYWHHYSEQPDNDGTVIKPHYCKCQTGRWHRLIDGHINVQWFGARGESTQKDVSTQFRQAIEAAQSTDLPVFIPPGRSLEGRSTWYKVEDIELTKGITINCSREAIICGVQETSTIFRVNSAQSNIHIVGGRWIKCKTVLKHQVGEQISINNSTFADMHIEGDVGFELDAAVGCKWHLCQFNHAQTAGIVFTGAHQSNQNTIENCKFQHGNIGISFQAHQPVSPAANTNIRDCWFEGLTAEAIKVNGSIKGIHITGCYFEDNSKSSDIQTGFALTPDSGNSIIGVSVENCFFAISANETARILVTGQTSLVTRDCKVFLPGVTLLEPECKDEEEKLKKLKDFQSRYATNRNNITVLIANTTINPQHWTIAGFNDDDVFKEMEIDNSEGELFVELNKEPRDRVKTVELIAAKLGISLSKVTEKCFVRADGKKSAAVHLWNNYLSSGGNVPLSTYLERLYKTNGQQPVSYSVFVGSGNVTGDEKGEWHFEGSVSHGNS
ncbi:MAG: right-handed parallel beta-helix repeat-containing protein [Nitrosomonas sp.]|nr:right-handed parallel beta-helix repeat-containing protein [Nitrosomonas sp.]